MIALRVVIGLVELITVVVALLVVVVVVAEFSS